MSEVNVGRKYLRKHERGVVLEALKLYKAFYNSIEMVEENKRLEAALTEAKNHLQRERRINCDCGKTTMGGEFVPVMCAPCETLKTIDTILEGKEG